MWGLFRALFRFTLKLAHDMIRTFSQFCRSTYFICILNLQTLLSNFKAYGCTICVSDPQYIIPYLALFVFRVSSWIADKTLWWLSLTQKRFSKFILSLLNTSIHVSSICTTDYTSLWLRTWGIKRLSGADFMINTQWFLADNLTFSFVSVSINIENNNRAITITTISQNINDASFCFLVKTPLFFVI